jgi:predicted transcriptional regulator
MSARSKLKPKILASLITGEKSLLEISQEIETGHSSVRVAVVQLLHAGTVQRRLEEKLESRKSLRHLYRLKE